MPSEVLHKLTLPWWEKFPFEFDQYQNLDEDLGKAALARYAADQGKTLIRFGFSKREFEVENNAEALKLTKDFFRSLGAHELVRDVHLVEDEHDGYGMTLLLPSGIARISVFDEILTGTIFSTSEEEIDAIRTWILAATKEPEEKEPEEGGEVMAMVPALDGYDIRAIGRVVAPLERGNYTQAVLTGYDMLVDDLILSERPQGKVAILDGPPGTGKTYLIRSLISEYGDEVDFLLVPQDLIPEFGKPEILPTLLQHKNTGVPLILILEDCDSLLTNRQASNMKDIAAVLNLGDGILGDLLGIRIIATTNSPLADIDPALRRPGRLSVRIEVGQLDVVTARAAFSRLAAEADMPAAIVAEKCAAITAPMTLAEVYALVKAEVATKPEDDEAA